MSRINDFLEPRKSQSLKIRKSETLQDMFSMTSIDNF